MTIWQIPPVVDIPADLLALTGDSLLAELLVRRGISTPDQALGFLNPDAYQPTSPQEIPDIDRAVERLMKAIAREELICVWGDFDVDGQTSTTLLVSLLRNLGGRVCYYIPDRITESHGIKLEALQLQLDQGVDLILTCDTGIGEHKAVQTAQVAGVEVIITDHHDLPEALPAARAVINPKRLPPDHPLRELPGAGVAFKLAEALFAACDRAGEAEPLLDLVALGIVADVARQVGDTRYLLQRGLAVLSRTDRVGLHAILENANLSVDQLTEDHIGFWLAPRLNALGRLGDANLAVELLTTTDLTRARTIALQLEALNDRRKLLVDRVVVQALAQLEDTPTLGDYNGLVLAGIDWHPGVIGIAASRLAEHTGKPVVLIAQRPDGTGRGSARSVSGCDIHQAIKSQAALLLSYGGHPMAAGLSLSLENLDAFRYGLSAALSECAPVSEISLELDAIIELSQISPKLLNNIQKLAPFGAGNPPVILACTSVSAASASSFGRTGAHRRVVVVDETGCQQEVIWWSGATEPLPTGKFDLAFTLSRNDFSGGDAVQVTWAAARYQRLPAAVAGPALYDWRHSPQPEQQLNALEADETIVWAEGVEPVTDLPVLSRQNLYVAKNLVIWIAPPGQDLLQQALKVVQPQQLYLVARPSPYDSLPPFIKRLMGLLKYAIIHKSHEVVVEDIAAMMGHRASTVRLGIDWLVAQGKLVANIEDDDLLLVRVGAEQQDQQAVPLLTEMLKTALAETAAHRGFVRQASASALLRFG